MNYIKKYLLSLIERSYKDNDKNIISLLEINSSAKIVDLGCDDGRWTKQISSKIHSKNIFGVEIVEKRRRLASKRKIEVHSFNLNEKFQFKSNFFDVVHSNQVIEHLYNTDLFISEIYRILKPGGYAIIGTENLSSWHNIFALTFGFQPFSMTNYSDLGNIGNPFSLWNGKITRNSKLKSWQHNRLFSYFGLVDIFKKHKFTVEIVKTSGYYPFPGVLSKIDPVHGHWITIKVRK